MKTETKNLSFLLIEGQSPSEIAIMPNITRLSGEFNPYCQYGAYCVLTDNPDNNRTKILNLFGAMWDYIPFEYLNQIVLISKIIGASGTKNIEYKSTFAWKYMPLKKG